MAAIAGGCQWQSTLGVQEVYTGIYEDRKQKYSLTSKERTYTMPMY